MKLRVNLVYPVVLIVLFTLSHLECSFARNLASSAEVVDTPKANLTSQQNASTALASDSPDKQGINKSPVTTLPSTGQTQSLKSIQSTSRTAITHILRKKRETEIIMPFDFDTLHLPCDVDQRGRNAIIHTFPNHCIWIWNNRFVHEGYYRVYKTYQLEAFFFGQFYERLRRFEVDPHSWDYSGLNLD